MSEQEISDEEINDMVDRLMVSTRGKRFFRWRGVKRGSIVSMVIFFVSANPPLFWISVALFFVARYKMNKISQEKL